MMKAWADRLKFKWRIYFVYLLIKFAAFRSKKMKAKLAERDIAIAMQCKDKSISRTIRAKNGKVSSQKGEADDVVAQIVWASPEVGARVIMKLIKGDPKALMQAVMDKDLMPQGDAKGVRWFLDVVGLLTRIFHGEKASPKK